MLHVEDASIEIFYKHSCFMVKEIYFSIIKTSSVKYVTSTSIKQLKKRTS